MIIGVETFGEAWVIVLAGRLDSNTCDHVAERLDVLMAEAPARLLVDCERLAYVSSAGLRVLLVAARKAKAAGATLSFCLLQPIVQEVFDLSGFSSILTIHPDRATALDSAP